MDNPLELLFGIAAILTACASLVGASGWAYRLFATSTQTAHESADRKDQELRQLLEAGLKESKEALARTETRHKDQITELKNDYEKRTDKLANEVRDLAQKVHTLEGEKKALMDTETNLRQDLNDANQLIGKLQATLEHRRTESEREFKTLREENEKLREQVRLLLEDNMRLKQVNPQPSV